VGFHVFKIPNDEDFPLHPRFDPVLTLGSLRDLMESNPDLEFFVSTVFPEQRKVAFVSVFVRSLPRGVDIAFDNNVSIR